jgi:hypothetical protein
MIRLPGEIPLSAVNRIAMRGDKGMAGGHVVPHANRARELGPQQTQLMA